MIQWLGLLPVAAKGPGSIPGWGTKVPQASQYSQKTKKTSPLTFCLRRRKKKRKRENCIVGKSRKQL